MPARERLDEGGGNYFAAPKTSLKFIRSGSKLLDLALGGGWARGRVANIVGDKSTGKTLLCIEGAAYFINDEPRSEVFYREAESAFDKPYAAALGMPIDRVKFGEPIETVEDLFEDLTDIVDARKNKPALAFVDSLDALSDRTEMANKIDKASYGQGKAKAMSQTFRRLVRKVEASDVTLIIVSQIRDKIGATFGRKWTRAGGKSLDFYASQVVYLAHLGQVKKTIKGIERTIGVDIRAKVDKNKVGLPFREAEFPILFGWGVDDTYSCLKWLKEVNSLKEAGFRKDLKDTELRYASEDIRRQPRADYLADMQRIHEVVERRWYEIETDFLPQQRKYGG